MYCFSGLPVLIVGVTLAVSVDEYKADGHCWLNVKNDTIWAFVGPVIFVLAVCYLTLSHLPVCSARNVTWFCILAVIENYFVKILTLLSLTHQKLVR